MILIKKINNNFALARDSTGENIIVEGRGIGFHAMPSEVSDLSKIKRTYYGIENNTAKMLESIQEDVLQIAGDTFEFASSRLPSKLNPNLTLILADHIQFCLDRIERHIDVKMPIYYDVEHLYPVESEIARFAMKLIRERLGIRLPVSEKTGIALNIINSEINLGSSAEQTTEIINLCSSIIEESMDLKIDRTSFEYSRFATHLAYLLKRREGRREASSRDGLDALHSLIDSIEDVGPELETCLTRIELELERRGFPLNEEERIYLTMHLMRICNRSQPVSAAHT